MDRSCTINGRTYVFHSIILDGPRKQQISCLLEPDVIPLLPNPIPVGHIPVENPNHYVKMTAQKGYGLFAARDIPPGELIVVEHPAVILPSGDFPPEIYDELASRLPEKQREEFLAMSNCRPADECHSHAEGIVRTNALMLELDPKGKLPESKRLVYGGAYPTINRANHSCGPNAGVKWTHATLSLSFYALRPIRAHEEIHKTYLEPALPRHERMAHLAKNYRFACDCPWCDIRGGVGRFEAEPEPEAGCESEADSKAGCESEADSKAECEAESEAEAEGESPPFTAAELARIAGSDQRRAELAIWIFMHPGYKKWSTDLARTDDVVITHHLAALAAIEQEGMHGLRNLFVEEIAMCYAILGDLESFRSWGEQVVRVTEIEDPPVSERFREWLVDPTKRMKKWGWRKKQREQQVGRRKLNAAAEDTSEIAFVDFQFLF